MFSRDSTEPLFGKIVLKTGFFELKCSKLETIKFFSELLALTEIIRPTGCSPRVGHWGILETKKFPTKNIFEFAYFVPKKRKNGTF